MNKTRYKIATLTGSAVMAAMLLSLLILNIVFNKKIDILHQVEMRPGLAQKPG